MEAEPQPVPPTDVPSGHLGFAKFPRHERSVGDARRWARKLLGWLTDEELGDVKVLLSELVTNSVTHTDEGNAGPVLVDVTYNGAVLRVEVTDDGSGEWGSPQQGRPDHGRGLAIVEQLSDCWGVRRSGARTVWFEIKTTGRR